MSTATNTGIRNGVLILSGYGLRIAVERGHLVVEDGIAEDRSSGRFSRVTKLRRLIVLGHSGSLSLEALRWLRDVGASFIQIDADGKVVAATGPTGVSDPRVLRAQVGAVENGVGFAIARDLIREKVAGQADVLRQFSWAKDVQAKVKDLLGAIDYVPDIDRLRLLESDAARAYWGAWEEVGLTFGKRDCRLVPKHWLTFAARHSPLSGSPRTAANPANAMLNYMYAILEAETRLAALALGCNTGLGFLHADQRWRDSLACDLMEPVRPAVDSYLLQLLWKQTFRRTDFFENRQGACRVLPPLAQQLAHTATRWSSAVAPIAERMVQRLFDSQRSRGRSPIRALPTPLTQRRRQAGRKRTWRRRADDPTHESKPGSKRARRAAEQHAATREWESQHWGQGDLDPAVFKHEILPGIQSHTLDSLARATGLSRAYCGRIRNGEAVPHQRHWEVLRRLYLSG